MCGLPEFRGQARQDGTDPADLVEFVVIGEGELQEPIGQPVPALGAMRRAPSIMSVQLLDKALRQVKQCGSNFGNQVRIYELDGRMVSKTNNSVDRALRLLRLLAGARRPVRFAEMQAQCGIPKGTLHSLLARLEVVDFVRRSAQGYEIGMAAFEAGTAVRAPASLRAASSPARLVAGRIRDIIYGLSPACHTVTPRPQRPAEVAFVTICADSAPPNERCHGALIGD